MVVTAVKFSGIYNITKYAVCQSVASKPLLSFLPLKAGIINTHKHIDTFTHKTLALTVSWRGRKSTGELNDLNDAALLRSLSPPVLFSSAPGQNVSNQHH